MASKNSTVSKPTSDEEIASEMNVDPSLRELLEEAISGAERLKTVSGIGTELGTLQNIQSRIGIDALTDEDCSLIELVCSRIRQFDLSNLA